MQRKQTGGGTPKLKELKSYELKIIEMVSVAERIVNVCDSEHQDSSILEQSANLEAMVSKKPKSDIQPSTPRPRAQGHQYPQSFVDAQMYHTSMTRVESSHYNSIRCLSELYKMPKEPHIIDAIKQHEVNMSCTQLILFPGNASSDAATSVQASIPDPSFNEENIEFYEM